MRCAGAAHFPAPQLDRSGYCAESERPQTIGRPNTAQKGALIPIRVTRGELPPSDAGSTGSMRVQA
jgi:hypothetical protein